MDEYNKKMVEYNKKIEGEKDKLIELLLKK